MNRFIPQPPINNAYCIDQAKAFKFPFLHSLGHDQPLPNLLNSGPPQNGLERMLGINTESEHAECSSGGDDEVHEGVPFEKRKRESPADLSGPYVAFLSGVLTLSTPSSLMTDGISLTGARLIPVSDNDINCSLGSRPCYPPNALVLRTAAWHLL
jgi:hypothetical protein